MQSSGHIPTCELLSAWIAPVGFGPNEVCDKAELLGQNIQNHTRLDITVRVAKDGETRGLLLERQLTFLRIQRTQVCAELATSHTRLPGPV